MIAIEEYTRQLLKDLHPVIVANRAPVDVQLEADEEYRFVRGGGGLVTGLAGLAQATGAVWVACAREGPDQELSASDGSEPMSLQTEEGLRYRVLWVKPPRLAYDLYYNTIANPLLWFVQHYLWNLAEAPILDDSTHHAWTEGYRRVNQMFSPEGLLPERRTRKPPPIPLAVYHTRSLSPLSGL